MADEKRSKSLLERAYDIKSGEEACSLYRDWAGAYEADMVEPLGYVGPRRVAEIAGARMGDCDRRLLDVGCGTGLVGTHLAELGVTNIDGLDFSQEMLDVARGKSCYRNLIKADLTQPLDIPSHSYDGFVSCGTFTHGHVGPDAFHELLRIARPQAVFCISVNAAIFEPDGFAELFDELAAAGRITIEDKVTTALIIKEPVDGVIITFRVN